MPTQAALQISRTILGAGPAPRTFQSVPPMMDDVPELDGQFDDLVDARLGIVAGQRGPAVRTLRRPMIDDFIG